MGNLSNAGLDKKNLNRGAFHKMFNETITTQQLSVKLSRGQAETKGSLSLLLPMKFAFQPSVHCSRSLPQRLAAHNFPKPQPSCLPLAFFDSIRFREHPAQLGRVSAMEMPLRQAGRQQSPESGLDDFEGAAP